MAAKQYEDMTRKELYQAARERGFRGISKCKKAQLLELLLKAVDTEPVTLPGAQPADGAAGSSMLSGKGQGVQESEAVRERPAPAVREPHDVYVDWGYPLPESYNIDRIGAAAKDPNWLFVHWDLSGNREQEVLKEHGQEIFTSARWHLRVLDMERNEYVDLPVNVDAHNWYVPVSEDSTYRIELGLLTNDGTFIQFAATREIKTPRSRPADNVSEEWMVADEQFQQFLKHAGTPGGSSELIERYRKKT